jgi:hypothetical protein
MSFASQLGNLQFNHFLAKDDERIAFHTGFARNGGRNSATMDDLERDITAIRDASRR